MGNKEWRNPLKRVQNAAPEPRYPRCAGGADCMMFQRAQIQHMVRALRSAATRGARVVGMDTH